MERNGDNKSNRKRSIGEGRKVSSSGSLDADAALMKQPKKDCRSFALGDCKYGNACKFSHEGASQSVGFTTHASIGGHAPIVGGPAKSSDACRNFSAGICKNGDRCRFAHVSSMGSGAAGAVSSDRRAPTAAAAFGGGIALSAIPPPPPVAIAPAQEKKSSVGSYMTSSTFDSLPICVESKRAIAEVMKYSNLSVVQEASLPTILQGMSEKLYIRYMII